MDATVGDGQFMAATSSCSKTRVRSRNSMLPGLSAAGVSPVEGCDEEDKCRCKAESRLMSIGACCGGGELRVITNPGGSIVSCCPALGNSPCTSPASRCCTSGGTARVVALVVLASGGGPPSGAGKHVHSSSSSLLARAASTA